MVHKTVTLAPDVEIHRRWFNLAAVGGQLVLRKVFSSIIVNPSSPNVVVAAITGGFAGRGAEAPPSQPGLGIFKSTNGGTNWCRNARASRRI